MCGWKLVNIAKVNLTSYYLSFDTPDELYFQCKILKRKGCVL